MEQFIRKVSEMEETILIPSRLLDLTAGDSDDRVKLEGKRGSIIKSTLVNTDLYRLYNIIIQMKIELLWSQDHSNDIQELEEDIVPSQKFKHARCPSSTSIQSVQSVSTSSDSESDPGIEKDSGVETEDSANATAKSFERHLRGLHRSIQRMTLAAEYLTMRYQADVGDQI